MTGWTSPTHIVALLLIALLVFGGKRLPEVGRSLGSGMREFKNSITGPDATTLVDPPRIASREDASAPVDQEQD